MEARREEGCAEFHIFSREIGVAAEDPHGATVSARLEALETKTDLLLKLVREMRDEPPRVVSKLTLSLWNNSAQYSPHGRDPARRSILRRRCVGHTGTRRHIVG